MLSTPNHTTTVEGPKATPDGSVPDRLQGIAARRDGDWPARIRLEDVRLACNMPCYYCCRHFGSRSRQNMQKHSVPSRVDCPGTVRFLRGPDTRGLRRVYHLPRYGVGLHASTRTTQ